MNIFTEFEDSSVLNFIYRNLDRFLDNPIRRWCNDPVKKLQAAGICSGMAVLEIGCGSGYFTVPAADFVGLNGCLHAIDIHPLAIETVSKKIEEINVTNVILSQRDTLETGFPSERFDLILVFGVIPTPVILLEKLLPEMHRLLKLEGKMAVWTAFPFWSPKSITRHELFKYDRVRDHVHIFRRARRSIRN